MTSGTEHPVEAKMVFLKGSEDILKGTPLDTGPSGKLAQLVRGEIGDALNAQHVSFLFGSGCSSHCREGVELGVPTMGPMAAEYRREQDDPLSTFALSPNQQAALRAKTGLDLRSERYGGNLEHLLEVLYSLRFVHQNAPDSPDGEALALIDAAINTVTSFVFQKCTNGKFVNDDTVLRTYEGFYRKLVYRDRALEPPWVFTTNYDLFNETAMDRIGMPYFNGFSGVVERRFNPAIYRHALASQMDLSERRWTTANGFTYLAKLHGSVSWFEDDAGLYPIREDQGAHGGEILIYPTPAKQSASLGSPYADMFREFQHRVVREQSVLFVCGYGFGDQHVNNIIFQGLTVPTLRLVIFADPASPNVIAKLRALGDPRIWLIGGEGPVSGANAHYFATVVDSFLPVLPGAKVDAAIEAAVASLIRKDVSAKESG
jgi:hypothetical protein